MSDQIRSQANPAFRFVVDVGGERQGAFTECTLPTLEWEVEEIKEGGLNHFVHQLPGRRKATKITLKNGIGKNELVRWYIQGIKEIVERKPISIMLYDPSHNPIITWSIKDAYPVKWTGPQLKTDANTIAIQTLELVCGEISVDS